jgi:hypothetical protein
MPGFKNWVDLTPLLESDLDDYVGKQVLMKFASNAARDAALTAATGKREGMATIQDDTNCLTISTGTGVGNYSTIGPVHGAPTAWTPVVVQGATPTLTVNTASYTRTGRWVQCHFFVSLTSAGTAANDITVSLPVTAATVVGHGSAFIFDASSSLEYPAITRLVSTTTMKFRFANITAAGAYLGSNTFTAALAASDTIEGSVSFIAASDA